VCAAGLEAEPGGFGPGWTDIIRFKALKNLRRRTVSALERAVPWPLAARVLDRRLGVSAHPVGRKPLRYRREREGEVMTAGGLRAQLGPPVAEPDGEPFLAYAAAIDVNWSAELEALHEESSRDHFIDVATRTAILDGIEGHVAAGDVVVDVGCSTGYLLEDLRARHPEAALVGVDLVAEGLRKAHETVPDALLLLADCTRLPLPEAGAAAVVSANVLEHVPDDLAALREIRRILRPGGRAAVVVPAGPGLYDYYDRFLDHERRYGRGELADRGRRAGLRVVRDGAIGGFLYPAFWAVKKRNRTRHGGAGAEERRRLVARDIARTQSSAAGAWACRAELALRRRGLDLPVGVRSLVVFERPA
jgi:SAM-dependent methyltransferase